MRYGFNFGLALSPISQLWFSSTCSKSGGNDGNRSDKWDDDWDGRSPKSLREYQENEICWDLNSVTDGDNAITQLPKATRNIILIRHGQYRDLEKKEENKYLTELGRQQARATGRRLAELRRSGTIPFTKFVSSTMIRAMETAAEISKELKDVETELIRGTDEFLCEGIPCVSDPDPHSRYPKYKLLEEGSRIEAAFRRYFYRALPEQRKDSYEVLVCHAHVIRFFVCRALQFPPQGWIRLSIPHASITWIRILPDGSVILQWFGNCSHFPPKLVTVGLEDK